MTNAAAAEVDNSPADQQQVKRLGLVSQALRFGVIGVGCALIDYSITLLLDTVLFWPHWLSKTIAFIVGTTTSYFVNRKFTFTGASTGETGKQAGKFAALYSVTFCVNLGTYQLLMVLFPTREAMLVTLFWAIAQGLGTLINFVMLKWVVFRD